MSKAPSTAQLRADSSKNVKKAKGKKIPPPPSILKNLKTYAPAIPYPPWTGDESASFKVAQKSI